MKTKVPIPLEINAIAGDIPVKAGTKTVAPNIAKRCCILNNIPCPNFGFSSIAKTIFWSFC